MRGIWSGDFKASDVADLINKPGKLNALGILEPIPESVTLRSFLFGEPSASFRASAKAWAKD